MPDREKVMRGLECCMRESNTNLCGICPYHDSGETCFGCMQSVMRAALALLREQMPRVMGFSEIASFGGVVYLEDIDKIDVIRAICNGYIVTFDLLSFSSIRGAPVGSVEDYNKRWRAWTARPTDEQRKAAKWDVGT